METYRVEKGGQVCPRRGQTSSHRQHRVVSQQQTARLVQRRGKFEMSWLVPYEHEYDGEQTEDIVWVAEYENDDDEEYWFDPGEEISSTEEFRLVKINSAGAAWYYNTACLTCDNEHIGGANVCFRRRVVGVRRGRRALLLRVLARGGASPGTVRAVPRHRG